MTNTAPKSPGKVPKPVARMCYCFDDPTPFSTEDQDPHAHIKAFRCKGKPLFDGDDIVAWLEGEASESTSDDFAWRVLRALAAELREGCK